MNLRRLEEILARFPRLTILVLGDFFLDQYWIIDPELEESSVETGLKAHQTVETRLSPGAAGTVVNNLTSLGVGKVEAVGFRGDDGNGWELDRGLQSAGASTTGLISAADRSTPVYTKPMFRGLRGECEGERFDLKNRTETPMRLQRQISHFLREIFPTADGVVVLDQVQEDDCGAVTAQVRKTLESLARQSTGTPVLADSRCRIGSFHSVSVKPNLDEASRAFSIPPAQTERILEALYRNSGRPVFLSRGAKGICLRTDVESLSFEIVPVSGLIDPVGAGDSVNAALIAALACGATPPEAAQLGLLTSSITVHKTGTTGTATPGEILSLAARNEQLLKRWERED